MRAVLDTKTALLSAPLCASNPVSPCANAYAPLGPSLHPCGHVQFELNVSQFPASECEPYLLMSIVPVLWRNASVQGRPSPRPSLYAGVRDTISTGYSDGDVMGVVAGQLHWSEAAGAVFNEFAGSVSSVETERNNVVRVDATGGGSTCWLCYSFPCRRVFLSRT